MAIVKTLDDVTQEQRAEFDSKLEQHEKMLREKSVEFAWHPVRRKRDALIKATDWAALPDSPHNTQALLDYRQALRDIPQTYDKSEDVVWPDNPLEA